VLEAHEGNRNSLLYWAACRLTESGYSETSIEALELIGAEIGLSPTEVVKTINSARRSVSV
jgi:hypothetical protein